MKLTPASLPPLSKSTVLYRHEQGKGYKIPYVWGAKPDLSAHPSAITGADCSGWVRWLVAQGTGGQVKLPEGSAQQHEMLGAILTPFSYADAIAMGDNLFVAFIEPTNAHPGHVWMVIGVKTLECFGGHGVGSRDPMAHPLAQEVAACYHWPGTL